MKINNFCKYCACYEYFDNFTLSTNHIYKCLGSGPEVVDCPYDGDASKRELGKPEECEFCMNHSKGDTLYESSDWDNGVGFDYIRNIEYCPLCGKLLKE